MPPFPPTPPTPPSTLPPRPNSSVFFSAFLVTFGVNNLIIFVVFLMSYRGRQILDSSVPFLRSRFATDLMIIIAILGFFFMLASPLLILINLVMGARYVFKRTSEKRSELLLLFVLTSIAAIIIFWRTIGPWVGPLLRPSGWRPAPIWF